MSQSMSVQERGLIVRCLRELSAKTVPSLDHLLAMAPDGSEYVVLDLSQADFADHDGLRWLIRLQQSMLQQCTALRVVVPPRSPVSRSLRLSEVDRALALYPSVREACAPEPAGG